MKKCRKDCNKCKLYSKPYRGMGKICPVISSGYFYIKRIRIGIITHDFFLPVIKDRTEWIIQLNTFSVRAVSFAKKWAKIL